MHGEMGTTRDIRQQLIAGAGGSLSDWRLAVEAAKSAGWTESEVNRVLFLAHPISWIVGLALICAVGGVVVELFFK